MYFKFYFMTAAVAGALTIGAASLAAETPLPIIDVHIHAANPAEYGPAGQKFCTPYAEFAPFDPGHGETWPEKWLDINLNPPCEKWVPSSADADALMVDTLAVMEKHNIYGLVGGVLPAVQKWKAEAPDRVMSALAFSLAFDSKVKPEDIATLASDGEILALAEVTNQYAGLAPDALEFRDYWKMAEDADLPVGIHIGSMPPGSAYLFGGKARISLGDPFLLEDVLVRHPKLRVFIMHAGYPHVDRTIAMMRQYPQLYVEVGVLPVTMPREEFHTFLRRLVQAGHGKRIMFGSDQMIWPGIIEASIDAVESADLTKDQKRDIFYNNAARFFRLDEATIAKHHGRQ